MRGRGAIFGGQERSETIRRLIPPAHDCVLDVGCRDGALLESLHLWSSIKVGIDIDEAALKVAKERGSAVCLVDLQDGVPFRDSTFDLVLAGEVLEHLPFPGQLLEDLRRVTKPGGTVVGSVPNAFRLKNRVLFLLGKDYERDPTHLRQFSIEKLRQELALRFSNVQIEPCVGKFAHFFPALTGNDLVWRAVVPDG